MKLRKIHSVAIPLLGRRTLHVMLNLARPWSDGPLRFERWGKSKAHVSLVLGRLAFVVLNYEPRW